MKNTKKDRVRKTLVPQKGGSVVTGQKAKQSENKSEDKTNVN